MENNLSKLKNIWESVKTLSTFTHFIAKLFTTHKKFLKNLFVAERTIHPERHATDQRAHLLVGLARALVDCTVVRALQHKGVRVAGDLQRGKMFF